MPHLKVQTSSGPINFNYTISTPTCSSATTIQKDIPTIIFLHPVYIAQVIYHPQFVDLRLRRFNLIALDSRGHGETIGDVPATYRRATAADDVYQFMETLGLPACHLFGLSMGACVSLQLAVTYPEKVLSIYLVSPLPLKEPPEVIEGRQEIYDCWVQGYKDPKHIDRVALDDSIYGALQLAFNSAGGSLGTAMNAHTTPQGFLNWAPDKFDQFHTISVKFFADRNPHPQSALRKVICPVKLVHCSGDIAYPVKYTEELGQYLKDAGIDVSMTHVPNACHFGSVTHADEINPDFLAFVLKHTHGKVPPSPIVVTSPFETILIKAGWDQDEGSDDDI